ncbi:putative E3 ubiquitin-protein ligase HECTD1 [Paratrimastix pyriformis]|uniref:E3 ubiquitin-protein ligase HECTD1 n=1 Tax=Paratrimastix pyriformis TaxID=342808 RepID=A0ABQ8UI26_9EUKA|nr:putative E3 ubiquitin-protein ligase HECTD1 [Paratrimastix pyriformis]
MQGSSNDTEKEKRPPCRDRRALEYLVTGKGEDEAWRCPACHAHLEDPVCLSCEDVVCRACATVIGGVCPICCEKVTEQVTACPKLLVRFVERVQCYCPNRGLGCETVMGVLTVERHLGGECEWREEECPRCHQQVRRAEMGRHQATTCAAKPMPCGFADVGCETRCPQGDLAAHERDGVVAHVGLLRHQLAATKAQLAQTQHDLAQTREQLGGDLEATKARLGQTQAELAQTREATEARLGQTQAELAQTQHDLVQTREHLGGELAQAKEQLANVQSRLDLLLTPPPTPEGLEATWDEATMQVAIVWRPVAQPAPAAAACCAAPPVPTGVRYRVHAAKAGHDDLPGVVVYTGPECRCRYTFPPGQTEAARFLVVAVRGLAESDPSAPATCAAPGIVFTYDHDMDERGLFYYIGTQGRTQPWQNPALAGWVTVTRSQECAGKVTDSLGRQPSDTWHGTQPNSWWQVDLGARRLFVPTRYTIRHCSQAGAENYRLQSWRLEGSLDGASWRTLDEHTNEPNAIPARVAAMATFTVLPARAFPARFFRVLMTGPSPNGQNQFAMSGFELYGTLKPEQN